MLKVTNERQTHRFAITKENEDLGPRFLADFNGLAFQMGSNAQQTSRPQTAASKGGAANKNKG